MTTEVSSQGSEVLLSSFNPELTTQEIHGWVKEVEKVEKVARVQLEYSLGATSKASIYVARSITAGGAFECEKRGWEELHAICKKHGLKKMHEVFNPKIVKDLEKLLRDYNSEESQKALEFLAKNIPADSQAWFKDDLLEELQDLSNTIKEVRHEAALKSCLLCKETIFAVR